MRPNTKIRIATITILLVLLSSFTFIVTAQSFETVKKGGFDIESGSDTGTTITIDSKVFELSETTKGTLYVKCLSNKTGSYYPVWIGQPANLRHEGKAVYKMKSGKHCIYKIGKGGNPYAVYLKQV
tara:strand:- start:6638 stop:7015 length:378 start_codon:yes stop_codon:yes gene_type:complete